MFTCFAQLLGMTFLLSLLYVMVHECHACWKEEQEELAQTKRSNRFYESVDHFLVSIAHLRFPNH